MDGWMEGGRESEDTKRTPSSVKFFPGIGRFLGTPGEICRVDDMYGNPTPKPSSSPLVTCFPGIASITSISVAPRPWFWRRSQCVVRSQPEISWEVLVGG